MRLVCGLALAAFAALPAQAEPWTGSYGGFQFGLAAANLSGATTGSGEDVTIGAHVGYGFTLGDYVLGGEIEHDSADIDLESGGGTISSLSRLKVRAGTGLGGALIYGTAGLAHAGTSIGDENGYFVGAGIGREVGDGWILGGEILYHNFLDVDGLGTNADATTLGLRASFRF